MTSARNLLTAAAIFVWACASTGCASTFSEHAAQPLDLFPKMKDEVMSDAQIARALDTPIDLKLPARVLVIGSEELACWQPRSSRRLAIAVADGLADSAYFQPVLSLPLEQVRSSEDKALPIQRLREQAARFRAPYALVTFTDVDADVSANPLCLLYAPLVTLLFVPGETVETHVAVEAALVDVRTGAILFSVTSEGDETDPFVRMGHTGEARGAVERRLLAAAGAELGKKADRAAKHGLLLQSGPPAALPKG